MPPSRPYLYAGGEKPIHPPIPQPPRYKNQYYGCMINNNQAKQQLEQQSVVDYSDVNVSFIMMLYSRSVMSLKETNKRKYIFEIKNEHFSHLIYIKTYKSGYH